MENENNVTEKSATEKRPCGCMAPIAFTCVDENDTVRTTLYHVNENMESSVIFSNTPGMFDADDYNLICVKCGTSWVDVNEKVCI